MSIKKAIDALHRAFNMFNKEVFNNKLPQCIIIVVPKGKTNAYGWFTPAKIWTDSQTNEQKHEINITAEHLNRPYYEVLQTLLHEMIHFYCAVHSIKDTSRNGTYHNKNFKLECERHGMYFDLQEPDKKYGWYKPLISNDIKIMIDNYQFNQNSFRFARHSMNGLTTKKKSNSYKWICEGCNCSVRSTKPIVNLVCLDCGVQLLRSDLIDSEAMEGA